MGKTIKRESCNSCNSKDNLCTFLGDNGSEYQKCVTPNCTESNVKISNFGDLDLAWEPRVDFDKSDVQKHLDLRKQTKSYRGIGPDICNMLGIREAEEDETFLTQYVHTNLDGTIDIKYRWPDKKFSWCNPKSESTSMFALDKCTDFSKPLCITEGNEDCASLWEIGYQACSLFSAGAEDKNVKQDLEYINKFSSIIICVDNDLAGQAVTKNLLNLLQHKQVFIMDFAPYKDANEYLINDREGLISKRSVEVIPSGLVQGNQLNFDKLKNQVVRSIPLPWPGLDKGLNGLEYGCLYLFLAGTSTGKSTVLRELAYWYRNNLPNLKIANFFFEENEDVTPLAYLALELNVPLGTLRREIKDIDQDMYNQAVKKLIDTDKLMFINKDFNKNINNLLTTIEYLVKIKKYELIIIDHISYIIGRTGTSKNGERIDIDNFLYKLQDITQRLGCIIVAVSHINESNGTKRWDEGEIPNIYSGRGSKALAQVPDGIIGLARNITNEYEKSVLSLYNLKNRWHSNTGKTDELIYIEKTGRLIIK